MLYRGSEGDTRREGVFPFHKGDTSSNYCAQWKTSGKDIDIACLNASSEAKMVKCCLF